MAQRPARPAAPRTPSRPARPAVGAGPPAPPPAPARPAPPPSPVPRPAQAPAGPPVPAPRIAPYLFGFDRSVAPAPGWLTELFDASNLRFAGAYVDGPPVAGNPPASFTVSSRSPDRHWMDRLGAAAADGWGIVFFYIGYSSSHDTSADSSTHPPAGQPTQERGRLHAQHIKTIIGSRNPGWAGGVVMIDNENSAKLDLDSRAEQPLRDYYLALCEELVLPGPGDAPPMRPGFYLHSPVAVPLLRVRPDLFVWDVEIDVADGKTTNTVIPPFDPAHPTRIEVGEPHTRVTLRPVLVTPPPGGAAPAWNAWPVGRQFRFYIDHMPQRGSPITRVRRSLTPTKPVDFDCALVRSPAFPVAEPRVTAFGGRPDPMVLRGTFAEPSRGGDTGTPPMMPLHLLGPRRPGPHPETTPALAVEPDAPIVAVPPERPTVVFSQLRGGVPVEWRLQRDAWVRTVLPTLTGVSARRIRALAAARQSDRSVHLFTVSSGHRLHAQRRPAGGPWSEPAPMAGDLRLHPFGSPAAAARGRTVEVVFLDRESRLVNAWWSRGGEYPGKAHTVVDKAAPLLPGGALVALAPTQDDLLALGIGRDLRLHLADYRAGRGWEPPRPLGRPEDRLTPHARFAAQVVTPELVEVCALTHRLQPVVYQLRLSEGSWQSADPRPLPAIPPRAPRDGRPPEQGSPVEPAYGWVFNPFGDVTLGRTTTGRSFVTLSAHTGGTSGGKAGAVSRFLDGNEEWWLYR
ncbi:hypothetical protein ACFWWA_27830 [Streptomyces goshikiensis]|uniref:hypothetical protein n=1 Tax=Streptomyces goshikiensis TaxID=1942 RepID=UPI003655CA17